MKQLMKQPSRLRPFNHEDRYYFEHNKATTFDGYLEQISSTLRAIVSVSEGRKKRLAEGDFIDSEPRAVSLYAKMMRTDLRDLKVYINQFMETLEQIEVNGEWK